MCQRSCGSWLYRDNATCRSRILGVLSIFSDFQLLRSKAWAWLSSQTAFCLVFISGNYVPFWNSALFLRGDTECFHPVTLHCSISQLDPTLSTIHMVTDDVLTPQTESLPALLGQNNLSDPGGLGEGTHLGRSQKDLLQRDSGPKNM